MIGKRMRRLNNKVFCRQLRFAVLVRKIVFANVAGVIPDITVYRASSFFFFRPSRNMASFHAKHVSGKLFRTFFIRKISTAACAGIVRNVAVRLTIPFARFHKSKRVGMYFLTRTFLFTRVFFFTRSFFLAGSFLLTRTFFYRVFFFRGYLN